MIISDLIDTFGQIDFREAGALYLLVTDIMARQTLLTPAKVATLLGVSPITVRKWAQKGLIPAHVTAGGHRRFYYAEVEQFARSQGMTLHLKDNEAMRILVVEDDRQFAMFVSEVISDMSPELEVINAYDGFDAGRQIQKLHPEIVVMDLMLPGMDGFSVCERLKEDPETRAMRVIAMTGHYSSENVERILSLGAEACLKKPFRSEELISVLALDEADLNKALRTQA